MANEDMGKIGNDENNEKIVMGGQAVIEGVMMRSQEHYVIVVRRKDGTMVTNVQQFISITKSSKFFAQKFIRGIVVLVEMLVLGIKALSFSADVYAEPDDKQHTDETLTKKGMGWDMIISLFISFAFGILLFVFVPLWATSAAKVWWHGLNNSIMFNIVDGVIRLAIFLLYIVLISFLKDIRRVFEYHGAEHKAVFAYESGQPVTVENARQYSTLHPRCGTTFMFIVIALAIVCVSLFPAETFLGKIVVRLAVLPLVASISYELMRWLSVHRNAQWARMLLWPGLMLQRLTTREPDDTQLEVAVCALNEALIQLK